MYLLCGRFGCFFDHIDIDNINVNFQVVDRSHQTPFFDKFGSYVADICGLACTHKVYMCSGFGDSFAASYQCHSTSLISLSFEMYHLFFLSFSCLFLLHVVCSSSFCLSVLLGAFERAARDDGDGHQSAGGHHSKLRPLH